MELLRDGRSYSGATKIISARMASSRSAYVLSGFTQLFLPIYRPAYPLLVGSSMRKKECSTNRLFLFPLRRDSPDRDLCRCIILYFGPKANGWTPLHRQAQCWHLRSFCVFLPLRSTIAFGSIPKSRISRLARELASLTAFFSALRM